MFHVQEKSKNERQSETQKKWRQKNPNYFRDYERALKLKNPDKASTGRRKIWMAKNPEKIFTQREYLRKLRNNVIDKLGGKCATCGFYDKRALQIDHVNGGGSKERKERKYKGSFHAHVLKSFLAKENKYQLLCANCNWIKRFENKEAKGRIYAKI